MDNTNGYYDSKTRTIYPVSTSTWSGLSGSTWATWNKWAYEVSNQIIWVTDVIDLGLNPQTVNLKITCEAEGTVSYKVYTSPTGVFAGEETLTTIAHGATNVPAFKANFMRVVVYCDAANDIDPSISEITIETNTPKATEIIINDLDTSTCAGTNTARIVPLPVSVGTIIDMKVTPHEVTAYPLDVYVSNTATSTYVIPKIISKAAANPTIALVGVDNHPRDAVVDIIIKALPTTFMRGNSLVTE